ncbi:MAG: hypothetical protein ACFE9L_05600 [Candidatus Hodarchaeota archaeon]
MFQGQAESIFVQIDQEIFAAMIKETSLWPGKETGGMMFGEISRIESDLEIRILKTIIPEDDHCIRKSVYFEIDPDFAKKIVENEKYLYLGNWHCHLGYGGPSQGDLKQIEDFFDVNPHLNIILTFIIDFSSEEDYNLIIEVYMRLDHSFNQRTKNFEIYRVPQENITFFTEKKTFSELKKGISKEKLDTIKNELVKVNNSKFSINEVKDFAGQTPDERIISFPYQFSIETLGKKEVIHLLILISFPPDFPDGQIFIDLSSQDLSKNITFEKHPADILNEPDLIEPFLLSLKASLEDEVPSLLKKPLWEIMRLK